MLLVHAADRAVCPCCGSMLPDYAYMLFIVLVIGLFSGALANGLQKKAEVIGSASGSTCLLAEVLAS
jgi:hypothetical protein